MSASIKASRVFQEQTLGAKSRAPEDDWFDTNQVDDCAQSRVQDRHLH